MADIFETMWAMGVPASDMTDVSKVEPFRISTVGERLMLRRAMEHNFEVGDDGYVENPWGFPPMPLPVHRDGTTTGLMIAPSSVSFEGLGHPVYWIAPHLTRRTPEERQHPERWNVRMFYLIMALGMYDPDTLHWYNVPRSQGVDYDEQDWIAYRQGTSSALDTVKPLDEGDLIEPIGTVQAQTQFALERCVELQSKVWSDYRAQVAAAYATAVASTQGRSEWDALDGRIKATTMQIAESLSRGTIPTSLVPEVYQEVDELERIVTHTERCALLLSIPVLGSSVLGDRAAAAATAINAANADIDVDTDTLRLKAHELFELSATSRASEFVGLHDSAVAIYHKAWRAMIVAARNLVRASQGENIYQSWEAFELVENAADASWPPLEHVLAGIAR